MAWNQPKPDDDKPGEERPDPWGNKRRPERQPPDMDDALEKLLQALKRLLAGASDSRLFAMVLPALLAITVVSGFFQVEPGGQALVFRLGELRATAGPGLHWRLPLVDSVRGVNVGRPRELPLSISVITADENVVTASVQVRYQVNDVRNYLTSLADPEAALAHAVEAHLHGILGLHTLGQLMHSDHGGADSIVTDVQADMDHYHAGITVTDVKLTEMSVPRDTAAAYADVTAAGQEQLAKKAQAETDANRSRTDAQTLAAQLLAEANAYQHEAIANAQAEADRFAPLLAAYHASPAVVRSRLYLDTMQAVLDKATTVVVADKGINPSIYLPSEKAQAAAPAGSAAAPQEKKP